MSEFDWAILLIGIVMYAFSEAFRIFGMAFMAGILFALLALDHTGETNFLLSLVVFALLTIGRGMIMYLNSEKDTEDE